MYKEVADWSKIAKHYDDCPNFSFLNEIKKLNHYCDHDMSDEAIVFYQCFFPWFAQKGMRGDVMCSFSTTFGKNNSKTNNFIPLKDGTSWKRGYTKDLLDDAEFVEALVKFRAQYHSLANFWVMPKILNKWRGTGKDGCCFPAQGDYFDIFLKCIQQYYQGGMNNPINVQQMFKNSSVAQWIDLFGVGNEGFEAFVEKNYLSAFVFNLNGTLEVKDIFSPKFRTDNPEPLGTYHWYNESLPQQCRKSTPINCAREFLYNSLWALEQRNAILQNTYKPIIRVTDKV